MGKARYRRKIKSLEARIQEHQEKIERERRKAMPDEGLIYHWEREIKAFQDGIHKGPKAYRNAEMKVLQQKAKAPYLSPRAMTLLNELRIECQHILKLLAQLEMTRLSRAQVEDVLGQLSAAVLHLHEHTRDLDAIIDEDLGEARSGPLE